MIQAIGTPSLKSLALKYLSEQKQVHTEVQQQVHPPKKRTYGKEAIGTLFQAENGEAHRTDEGQKIDSQIITELPVATHETPDPAALAHAQRMLISCPVQGRSLHCWYCSRCSEAGTCSAWRSRRADVEFFRKSEKPYSLNLLEEMEAEGVLQ